MRKGIVLAALVVAVVVAVAAMNTASMGGTVSASGPRIANTGGVGIALRTVCEQEARRGFALEEGAAVAVVAEGVGRCDGWLLVEAPNTRTWVRIRYVEGYESIAATPSPQEAAQEVAALVLAGIPVPPTPQETAQEVAALVLAGIPVPPTPQETAEQVAALVLEGLPTPEPVDLSDIATQLEAIEERTPTTEDLTRTVYEVLLTILFPEEEAACDDSRCYWPRP